MTNTNEKQNELLLKYFGYESFKTGQAEIIENILNHRDILCLLPTGGGKSVCYQIPALMLCGVTLVISPLISLMTDQVYNLTKRNIPAVFINSSISTQEYNITMQQIALGKYKIIYIAPERLNSKDFLRLCNSLNISMIVVDEAHCISHWGHSFRPDYLKIKDFVQSLSTRPIVAAFTATATEYVMQDISKNLALIQPFIYKSGFDRKNLSFSVIRDGNKFVNLQKLLIFKEKEFGIIYCITRKQVDMLHIDLTKLGYNVGKYHAGLSEDIRKENQENFLNDKISIMIATNAFGMGIDKPNISFVIHYCMPKNLENYYQEAGRAGRDGKNADCIMLFGAEDINTNKSMIDRQYNTKNNHLSAENSRLKTQEYKRLSDITTYCTHNGCLREYILKYFDDDNLPTCDNCSNCLKTYTEVDLTIEAKKILFCISKTRQKYDFEKIVKILSGNAKASKFMLKKHGFGMLSKISEKQIKFFIDLLVLRGYLKKDADDKLLLVKQNAKEILNNRTIFTTKMFYSDFVQLKIPYFKNNYNTLPLPEVLLKLRDELSTIHGLPRFMILRKNALLQLSQKLCEDNINTTHTTDISSKKLKIFTQIFTHTAQAYNYCLKEKYI